MDLNAQTAFFENGGEDTYDIVGADGTRSFVRKALLDFHASPSSPSPYKCIDEPLDGGFKDASSKTEKVRALALSAADESCLVGFF